MAEKAEKERKILPGGFISVVINFRTYRFMTVISKKCRVSDLMKEVENTLNKVYSKKVEIKTLKNALNAVLPKWYNVVHLIRDQDEVYAFTDNAAELMSNMDDPPEGNNDSGFTSPARRLPTIREASGNNFREDDSASEVFSVSYPPTIQKIERTKDEYGKTTADKPNNQNVDHQNNVGTTAVHGGHSSSDEEDIEEYDGEAKEGGANVKKTDVGDVREKDGGKIDGNGAFSCKKRGENTGPSHEILAKDKNGSERAIGAIPSQKKTMQTTGKSSSAESFNRKLLKDASNGKISSDSSSDTESEEDEKNGQEKTQTPMKKIMNAVGKSSSVKKSFTQTGLKDASNGKISSDSSSDTESEEDEKNGQKKAQTPKKKIMNTEGKSSNVKKSFTQTGLKDVSNGKISSDSSSDTESEEDEKNGQEKAQTPKKKIMNTEGKSSSVKSFTLTGWKDVSDGNSSSDSESEEDEKDGREKVHASREKTAINNEGDLNSKAKTTTSKDDARNSSDSSSETEDSDQEKKRSAKTNDISIAKQLAKTKTIQRDSFANKQNETRENSENSSSSSSSWSSTESKKGQTAKELQKDNKNNKAADVKKTVAKNKSVAKTQPSESPVTNSEDIHQTSTTRISPAAMSAKKVTSWLWSNPVSGDGDVNEHSLQSKTTSKSKTKESKKASADASKQNKTKDTTSTGHGNETSKKKSQESGSSSRKSEKVNSKKRRLADEFDQQSSSKAKKNKTKQSVNDEQMKRTTNEDKTPNTPNRPAPLSLPRTPKGLSALADDESECDTGSATKNMANPLKQKGFLSPFNKPRKRLTSSKTPKPQVKKLSSTQTTETIEPNSKERKFLDSGKMSLDALLNDKSINW